MLTPPPFVRPRNNFNSNFWYRVFTFNNTNFSCTNENRKKGNKCHSNIHIIFHVDFAPLPFGWSHNFEFSVKPVLKMNSAISIISKLTPILSLLNFSFWTSVPKAGTLIVAISKFRTNECQNQNYGFSDVINRYPFIFYFTPFSSSSPSFGASILDSGSKEISKWNQPVRNPLWW